MSPGDVILGPMTYSGHFNYHER